MPTPVSALIHAATMVKDSRLLMWVNKLWYHYVLESPYIKFIYILSLPLDK
jgi:NADH:ubiquinone oxidoreductase subunit 5 (subunit L)/multisubunit Na+/H+ antiporter MnhA subunit